MCFGCDVRNIENTSSAYKKLIVGEWIDSAYIEITEGLDSEISYVHSNYKESDYKYKFNQDGTCIIGGKESRYNIREKNISIDGAYYNVAILAICENGDDCFIDGGINPFGDEVYFRFNGKDTIEFMDADIFSVLNRVINE